MKTGFSCAFAITERDYQNIKLADHTHSPMEIGILQVASQILAKIPSEKQLVILIEVLAKAALEGIN